MKIGTTLYEDRPSVPPVGGRVMDEAVSRGWVLPFAEGQYVYLPMWVRLFRALQTLLVDAAVRGLGFEEWMLPRMIPRDALDAFQFTQFKEDLLIPVGNGSSYLDPVQCISLYHLLRGTKLSPSRLPLKVVECLGGWTWRNERPEDRDGPYRSMEFARVEHIFLGTADQVTSMRSAVRSSITDLLTHLGIGWQVVVGSGCMDIPSIIAARERAATPDDVPVQDIEVPVRGALTERDRDPGFVHEWHDVWTGDGLAPTPNDAFYVDTDEVCGCTVEGDHLVENFSIGIDGGGTLWSGCCGIGVNRVVIGFLYQHGFDERRWPSDVCRIASSRTLEEPVAAVGHR